MTVRVEIGTSSPVDMSAADAGEAIRKHLAIDGARLEYVTFDEEKWEIHFKSPTGNKTVIRPVQNGRRMQFEVLLC